MSRIRKRNLLIAAVALTALAGIPGRVWAYESIPVETGGEIAGTIKLKGDAPARLIHKVIHDPEFCGETVSDDTYLVNPSTHALQNVVISVEGISRGKKPDLSTLELNNLKCRFQPRTLAAMVGDSYEVKNSDPVLHNTHLKQDDVTILNVAMPAAGKKIKKPMNQAGIINVRCDAHSFMKGNILVFDHPYFAVTDQEGSFRITDIPPGIYKLKIWHEGTPVKEREVSIGPSEKIDLSAELTAK